MVAEYSFVWNMKHGILANITKRRITLQLRRLRDDFSPPILCSVPSEFVMDKGTLEQILRISFSPPPFLVIIPPLRRPH
jgi:hypothetical protein